MKCVKVFLAATLFAAIGQVAGAQDTAQNNQQQIDRDRLHTAVQEICPVSGNKLGVHGPPVKAKIGQETIFLCCRGCLQGKVNPQHWATIHANFAKAQQICPVMKNPLPQNPKWTIVEGQIVYVCCPPCTKKVEADPNTYLQQVDQLYAASLQQRHSPR